LAWWKHQRRRASRLLELTEPASDIARPVAVLANPHIAAKMLSPAFGDVVVQKPQGREECLPVPPRGLWEGYDGFSEEQYLETGRTHTEAMLDIIRATGARPEEFARVLDFGCAVGRMLRWFPHRNGDERWGVDIKGDSIAWCQQYLSPPMLFAATTTLPHLPFEDGHFDLVYCGSVFTHIIDLPDTWMLELRRVTRVGGLLYVTIHDKHLVDRALDPHVDGLAVDQFAIDQLRALDARTGALGVDFAYISTEGGLWDGLPIPQVFYDLDYITARWSRLLGFVSATPDAYSFQTALLFEKR
jgi:SAM-dependent methyltransferase